MDIQVILTEVMFEAIALYDTTIAVSRRETILWGTIKVKIGGWR